MFVDIICVRDKKEKIQTKKNYLDGNQQVLHSIMLTLAIPGGCSGFQVTGMIEGVFEV